MSTDSNSNPKSAARGPTLGGMFWTDRTAWGKFGIIILALIMVSTVASLVTRILVFEPDYEGSYRIALIAPLSGESALVGRSLKRGAEQYVRHFNENGGIDGQFIELEAHDDAGDPAKAKALAEKIKGDDKVIGVIGPWQPQSVDAAATIFDQSTIAAMTLNPATHNLAKKHKALFALTYDQDSETRFLANYMRNVLGAKLASIVVDETAYTPTADLYTKTFERFGIPLRHRWTFDSRAPNAKERLAEIVTEIKEASDSGSIFLAMNERDAARTVKLMRDNKAVNQVMGTSMLGARAFGAAFSVPDYQTYTNGIFSAAPLMYDTANQRAQGFRSRYIEAYKSAPDWISAFSYESAHLISEALRALIAAGQSHSPLEWRPKILGYLASLTEAEQGIEGISGTTAFDSDGIAGKPIQIGRYDGRQIVSALTQLQPIGAGEVSNYIQAVREGRALYVNDRFMYKTSVVYSGMLAKEVRNFDPLARTFEMDFVVWFRYRGDFDPQDIVFTNAVEPIELKEPDREERIGDLNYRRYNLTGKFNANFLNQRRDYGTELFGTSFRHRTLNRNNVLYVVDIVGIGLAADESYLDRVRQSNVLGPKLGLVAERAWIAQDIVRSSGLGDPTFVGHGKPPPDFSQIDTGLVVKKAAISLRDFVGNEYLIYLLIFAFVGSVFAFLMDQKREGTRLFWNVQSWLLRAVSWPLLLLAAGSLVLNFAFQNLEFFYVDLLVPIYEALWWFISAALIAMAVERFVWIPLEEKTERNVPGSVRLFTSLAIFLFAAFGVVAFVLHQQLTSLLATSGLLAAIIGLAVQSNIANVFSGIVLNLERPFRIGDWIEVGDTPIGQVTDITWRSTKIKTFDQSMVSMPNGKVAEELIENFSHPSTKFIIFQTLHFNPKHDPERITELILKGLDNAKAADGRDALDFKWAKFVEVDEIGLKFRCAYDCLDRSMKNAQDHEAMSSVIKTLQKEGITAQTQVLPVGKL